MAHPPASSKEKTMPEHPRAVSSNTAPAAMLQGGHPWGAGGRRKSEDQQVARCAADGHCSSWAGGVRGCAGTRVRGCTGVRACGRGRGSGGGPGHEQVYRADSIVIWCSMPTLLPCISACFPAQHRQGDHDYRWKSSLRRRLAVCRWTLDPALRRPQSARVISPCTRARGHSRTHAHERTRTHTHAHARTHAHLSHSTHTHTEARLTHTLSDVDGEASCMPPHRIVLTAMQRRRCRGARKRRSAGPH
jgi:hypothetical protein